MDVNSLMKDFEMLSKSEQQKLIAKLQKNQKKDEKKPPTAFGKKSTGASAAWG